MARTADLDTPGLIPNRACRSCVRIKVKCVPHLDPSQNVCQRCHRLGKQCTTPAPVTRKQRGKSTRVMELEERIDRLSALMTPAQTVSLASKDSSRRLSGSPPMSHVQPDPVASTLHAGGTNVQASPFPASVHAIDRTVKWDTNNQPIARSGSPTMFTPLPPGRRDGSLLLKEDWCPIYMDATYEEELFTKFRRDMMKEYPCVVIDPEISNTEFKEERPFSYWAGVLAASNQNRQLHQTLYDEMMKALGHRMLFAGSKSIDLLQGILLLIGWHHFIYHLSAQLMNLLHLAHALLIDLSVAKPIRVQDKIRLASDTSSLVHGTELITAIPTLEEKRALLACYFVSSKAALTFSRTDPMRYSLHIDKFCQDLKSAMEYDSDLLLVELVQLHRVFGKYWQVDSGPTISSAAYRNLFQDEVERFRGNLPTSLQGNRLIEMEIASTAIVFLEPSYTPDCGDKIDRLDALHACVRSSDKFTKIMHSISSHDLANLSFLMSMSLVQILLALCRLSLFRSDDWDAQYARNVVNYGKYLQQTKDMYERVHEYEKEAFPNCTPWRFAIYAKKASHVQAWYATKVRTEESNENLRDPVIGGIFGNFDDAAWDDLMGNWVDFEAGPF